MYESRITTPTHSVIYDYWKDKCITKDGLVYIEGQVDYSTSIPVVYDWGEPECWCCRKQIDVYSYKTYERDLEVDEKRIWNYKIVKSNLEKAHIVPKALGGLNNPQNLFLLCKKCHAQSPDHINPIYFFKYIYDNRVYNSSGFANIDKQIRLAKLADSFNKDLLKVKYENINYAHINTHGGAMTESTMEAALIDSLPIKGPESIKDQEAFMKQIYKDILKNKE